MPQLNKDSYHSYCQLIADFEHKVQQWSVALPGLLPAQEKLRELCGEAGYAVETPVVYNRALRDVSINDTIKWIMIADNPGKNEQLASQNRYLVGTSGKSAENFFKNQLHIDFRAEVLIINKSPVHTPKTTQLRRLIQIYPALEAIFIESQHYMADLAWNLQKLTHAPIWMMGISELKPRGLFSAWYQRFISGMPADPAVYAFNHFSMGSFAQDFKKRRLPSESPEQAVLRIGTENSRRFFTALTDTAVQAN